MADIKCRGNTCRYCHSVGIAAALLGSSIHVCANVSMALVLGYGGTLVLAGEMTAGGLTSFLLYSVYVGFNFGSLRCVEIHGSAGLRWRVLQLGLFVCVDGSDWRLAGAKLLGVSKRVCREVKHLCLTDSQSSPVCLSVWHCPLVSVPPRIHSTVYGDIMKAVGASQRIFSILDRVPVMPPYDLPRYMTPVTLFV